MNCPLVIVTWEDSAQPVSAWRHLHDLPKFAAIECTSVGWLLQDDDKIKVLAQSLGHVNEENVQGAGMMTIPTRCVLKMEKLVEEERAISGNGKTAPEMAHTPRLC